MSYKRTRAYQHRARYCLNYAGAKPKNALKELDNRAVIIFVTVLLVISAAVCLLYKDVVLDVPQPELKYNFSDLVK